MKSGTNFLNGLELEQIDKRVRHQHEKPRVGIVQICTDDLVDFIQSLIERVAVDKKMLGCRRGVEAGRQVLAQRDQKLCFILAVIEPELDKPRMAQVPAVDLAGSVVHEIRQDIVFKPVIPEVGRIEPPISSAASASLK